MILCSFSVVHHNSTPPKATTSLMDKFNLIRMRCIRCHSPRIIKFLDGFGNWRIFCRTCEESVLEVDYYNLVEIKKLTNFQDYHTINNSIPR